MTQYIYMNHRIKQKKPNKPVIVCQRENPVQTIESNQFVLSVGGRAIGRVVFRPSGLPQCTTHEVKAWLELDDDVAVYSDKETEVITEQWVVKRDGTPLQRIPASEKKPGQPVVIPELK